MLDVLLRDVREGGYWIDREYWGKGIATKALSRFLCQVTERPLCALVARHNTASIRVLEKCGFAIVELRRGSADARGPVVEEFTLKLSGNEGRQPNTASDKNLLTLVQ